MSRDDLHKLIDEIPDAQVEEVTAALRRIVEDPEALRLIGFPWDDEPVTEDEERLVAEAIRQLDAGQGIEWPDVKRMLEADND